MPAKNNMRKKKIGSVSKKVLLILASGALLCLSRRPDYHFRILKKAAKEWAAINKRNLHDSIRNLYKSKMVESKENEDGSIKLVLSENGKKRILEYKLENLKIVAPPRWDGLWRIVMFDIPEREKKARDVLSLKLKEMGMKTLQKSVFVSPYDCEDEVNFVTELFNIKPYVRLMVVREIDNALDLKNQFRLL